MSTQLTEILDGRIVDYRIVELQGDDLLDGLGHQAAPLEGHPIVYGPAVYPEIPRRRSR